MLNCVKLVLYNRMNIVVCCRIIIVNHIRNNDILDDYRH